MGGNVDKMTGSQILIGANQLVSRGGVLVVYPFNPYLLAESQHKQGCKVECTCGKIKDMPVNKLHQKMRPQLHDPSINASNSSTIPPYHPHFLNDYQNLYNMHTNHQN